MRISQDRTLCIEACLVCASACNYCTSSCTKEENTEMMANCIQLGMECATICYATAQLLSLRSKKAEAITRLCAEMCLLCEDECNKHNQDHCKKCAEACRKCAERCRKIYGR